MEWAVEGGADYIIAETFNCVGEALLALDAIKQYGNGKKLMFFFCLFVKMVRNENIFKNI